MLLQEIEENLNKQKDIPYSQSGRLIIIKMVIIFKLIYRFNTIFIRIPASFFVKIDKIILKFIQKLAKLMWGVAKTIFKKNKVGRLMLPDFQTHYKATHYNFKTHTKATWYWHTNRCIEQCRIIENPQINHHIYSHLIPTKVTKHMGKNNNNFNKQCQDSWLSPGESMTVDTDLTPCTKINSMSQSII